MGHCERLLAVAGPVDKTIADKTQALASGHWFAFAEAERAAFTFARKIPEAPGSLTPADLDGLRAHFGPEGALDVVWRACRCHCMTWVADAFQLPLERENVFRRPPAAKREARKEP
jgi:hypothetical protein